MTTPLILKDWIASATEGLFASRQLMSPWEITSTAEAIIRRTLTEIDGYVITDGVAIHHTATIETGAIIKGPAIICPDCYVAATAYLRGGIFLDEGCIVGPACELKSVFMLWRSKVAHLSFVGDSIIGAAVNIEAGAIIANYRNERDDKRIRIAFEGQTIDTGVEKFGALVGDGVRIGANAVIAPGALLRPGVTVPRLSLIDQSA